MSPIDHPEIRQLQPTALWNNFADLNRVPRASKREQQVTAFAAEFGRQLGLETIVDAAGNVVIRKPATEGLQERTPVILQSHLDMVHQKNQATDFDFQTQGIEMELKQDWVWAKGTTLGADNGIGVAAIMAILAAEDIPHPPLEALFTVDEETGMTGAKGLESGILTGRIMLNLDTEEDDELTIGCAGGVDVTAKATYKLQPLPPKHQVFRLTVRGLKGGHSGMDIHLGRANANKIVGNLLLQMSHHFDAHMISLDGGSLRNAIPREATAVVALPQEHSAGFPEWLAAQVGELKSVFDQSDPGMDIRCSDDQQDSPARVMDRAVQAQILAALQVCPNGVHRMSASMPGLVETSNNLARVVLANGELTIGCLTRSSINWHRDDLARSIAVLWEMVGAEVSFSGDYPGWQPQPDAPIVRLMSGIYTNLFETAAKVAACHGGLECGILGSKYPDVQMISFGPNIRGAHSPEERVQISSVQKFWHFLLETLKQIP